MRFTYSRTILLVLFLLALPTVLTAQFWIPDDADVVNVKDYGALGDGQADDTKAIRAAIKFALDRQMRFIAPKIVYFPKGTYVISGTLESITSKTSSNNGWRSGLIMVGEDRQRTTLKLKNNSPNFGDKARPRPMIKTGSENHRDDGKGNEAFRHSVMSLTLDVGIGNVGAVGISYLANNRGSVENVTIKGGAGGYCGIRMIRQWPGPCLLKNVRINGFDYGMEIGHFQYSITMENIVLENQRQAGIYNKNNVLAIRKLRSYNTVPAITGMTYKSSVVLIDSELRNGSNQHTGISSEGNLLIRNTVIQGYGTAIAGASYGGNVRGGNNAIRIREYQSHEPVTQFASTKRSLNLPIEETPTFHTSDPSRWANIKRYGTTANEDDLSAIQKAIDSGKEIVYLPNGRYKVSRPIIIRKNVKKLLGLEAYIEKTANFQGDEIIRFDGTSSDYSIIEHLIVKGKIKHNSSKALALRHMDHRGYSNTSKGVGKLFVEDVQAKPYRIKYGQKVWARQLNAERDFNPLIKVENSTLWMLGYKTEAPLTVVETIGGATEVLGGLLYPLQSTSRPAFIAKDARVSYMVMFNIHDNTGLYSTHVKETRDGITKSVGNIRRTTAMYVGGSSSAPPTPDQVANGLYKIRPVSSLDKVLEVKVVKGNGDNVQQGIDENKLHQRWQLTRAGNGYYKIAPAHALSKGMDVARKGGYFQRCQHSDMESRRQCKPAVEDQTRKCTKKLL